MPGWHQQPDGSSCAALMTHSMWDKHSPMCSPVLLPQTRSNAVAWNPMEAFNFTVANEDCCLYTYDMRKLSIASCLHKVHPLALHAPSMHASAACMQGHACPLHGPMPVHAHVTSQPGMQRSGLGFQGICQSRNSVSRRRRKSVMHEGCSMSRPAQHPLSAVQPAPSIPCCLYSASVN